MTGSSETRRGQSQRELQSVERNEDVSQKDRKVLQTARKAIRGTGGHRDVEGSSTLNRALASFIPQGKVVDKRGKVVKPAETHAQARDRVETQARVQGRAGRQTKIQHRRAARIKAGAEHTATGAVRPKRKAPPAIRRRRAANEQRNIPIALLVQEWV